MSQSPDPETLPVPGVASASATAPLELAPPVELPPAPRLSRSRRWGLRPRDLAVLVRGASLMMAIGLSSAMLVMQVTGIVRNRAKWSLRDFVNHNQLTPHARMQMLGWLFAGAAVAGAAALVLYLWRRRSRAPAARAVRVLRTSRLFWPIMLPSLVWPLLVATDWDGLARISGVAMVALFAEMSLRACFGEIVAGRLALARVVSRAVQGAGARLSRLRFVSPALVVVVLGTVFYAVWMSYWTIVQHREFATTAADLGNYDTMFFNLMHGRPFRCPPVLPKGGNWSMLSNHAELTMFALVPLYAIRPGAETLLVLQAVALALGAIPVYRFAARRLPRAAATVLALAYLLYAPMHQANFYDVHFQPFAVVFTLWALDMLDARRPVLFGLFFVLALGCREDVPIGFAVVGVYLLLVGKHTRAAIVMMVVSVAYFVVIKFAVMPHFGSWYFADLYKDLYPSGDNSYGGIVKTMITNPSFLWKTLITTEKIVLCLLVLVPIAFLPLRRQFLWLSLLPAAPFTILTTGYGPTVEISFQYILLYVPFMFLATVVALASFGGTPQGRARLAGAIGGIAIATFLTVRIWGAMPPGDRFRGGFRAIPEFRPVSAAEKQKARDIAELAAKIPKDARVSVTEMEHPHVSTRLEPTQLRFGSEGAEYLLYSEDGMGADNARKVVDSGEFEIMEQRPASRMTLARRKRR